MSFKNTLEGTYNKIANQPKYATAYDIQAIVIANNRRFPAQRVISYDVFEQFNDRYAAERYLAAKFDLVTVRDFILPTIDSLYVELYITKRDRHTDKNQGKTTRTRYSAFAIDPPKLEMNLEDVSASQKAHEQLQGFIEMDFQLVEPVVTHLRGYGFSGPYEGNKPGDLLKYFFNSALVSATKAVTPDVAPFLDMYPPNNEKSSTVIVPSNTPLMKLPAFVQEDKGLYTTGIGRFFKNNGMYIYPLWHTAKYATAKSRLDIVSTPNNNRSVPDMTYTLNGEIVSIITSGEVAVFNKSEDVAKNQGNAVRYVRASSIMGGMSSSKNNKSTSNKAITNVAKSIEKKPDGLNITTGTVITDNPYNAMSELSKGLGFTVGLTWSNSNSNLIRPSMPCKFSFNDADSIVSYVGCVTGMRTTYSTATNAYNDRTFVSNTAITLFVKK